MRALFFCAALLAATLSQAVSLSLDTSSLMAPGLTAQQSEGSYNGLHLSIVNEGLAAVQIGLSQFSIGVVAGAGAEGEVSITSVGASLTPLFASPPMLIGPAGQFSTYTQSGFPITPTLGPETSGGLATIDLGWLPNTSGIFELVVRPIDAGSLLTSSHWTNPALFGLQPYSNTELTANGEILLATLTIVSVPEPATLLLLLGTAAMCVVTNRQKLS